MKKIYLLSLGFIFGFAVNAQTVIKVKNPLNKRSASTERSVGGNNSVNAIAANLICGTQYAAGTTMDLAFSLSLTNTDSEYGDSLSITLPAGFTINSALPSDSLGVSEAPTTAASGCATTAGGTKEPYRGISGQTVSWGNNDNCYGGIGTTQYYPTPWSITINVTIGAGVTGNQTGNFFVSGDGYGASPADYSGTYTIYPVGASIVDLKTTFIQPYNLTSTSVCNYGSDSLVAQIKNIGTTTESNISVTYSVNGVAQPATVVPGPLAPGDSSYVFWLPAFDFSATNTYALKAWTAQAGDVTLSNDTAALSFRNHVSIPLTSTAYTNGVETAAETADFSLSGTAASFTGLSTATFHLGVQALFTTVAATNPVGTYEVKISLPCMDVVNGETYRLSFWRRTNSASAGNGQSGAFTGLAPNALTTQILPYTVNTLDTWTKDSVDFTATANETRYFAIAGTGTVSATSQMNCRFDDINIAKITPTGVSNLANNNDIILYPNPSNGNISLILGAANAQVEVFSIVGEKVYSKSQLSKGVNALDLSSIAEGTYVVRILTNAEISTKKIVISK